MTKLTYFRAWKGKVSISRRKAELRAFLNQVRRGGEIIVMDRQTPVARIVPYDDSAPALTIRMPKPGAPRPCDVPLPPPLPGLPDIVEFLIEERGADR